jgi:hypothetical protein
MKDFEQKCVRRFLLEILGGNALDGFQMSLQKIFTFPHPSELVN